jgi:hypothetical protein
LWLFGEGEEEQDRSTVISSVVAAIAPIRILLFFVLNPRRKYRVTTMYGIVIPEFAAVKDFQVSVIDILMDILTIPTA